MSMDYLRERLAGLDDDGFTKFLQSVDSAVISALDNADTTAYYEAFKQIEGSHFVSSGASADGREVREGEAGVIKWVDAELAFGSIALDSGGEVVFEGMQYEGNQHSGFVPRAGNRVVFVSGQDADGHRILKVRLLAVPCIDQEVTEEG